MDEYSQSGSSPVLKGIVVAVVIVVIGGIIAHSTRNKPSATPSESSTPTITASSSAAQSTGENAASTYKDGTYTATGSYSSPGGKESVEVTVTLKGDIITDSTVISQAVSPQSKQYQGEFINGYKQYVTGKSIDTLSLSRVSGSSLTPKGFNSALSTIKTQAQS